MAKEKQYFALPRHTLDDIRRARDEKGLTQEQLADLIDKTRVTYNRLETGQMNVLSDTFTSTCETLGLEPHIYVMRKGEADVNVKEIGSMLRDKDAKIEELTAEISSLRQTIDSLTFQVELLKENRRLRKEGKSLDTDID